MIRKIKTVEELINYGLRKLGSPVINIELADEQIYDRLDDSVQMYSEFHYDGFSEGILLLPVKKDQMEYNLNDLLDGNGDRVTDKYILSVVNEYDTMTMNDYMVKASFHMLYNPIMLYNNYRDYDNFYATLQYIDLIRDEFLFKAKFVFNYAEQTIKLIENPSEDRNRAYRVYMINSYVKDDEGNPEISDYVYNDRWFKRYFVEQLRLQWGQNLSKYDSIELTGGGKIDGKAIYNEAVKNIELLETELFERYDTPPKFFMG